LCSKSTTTSSLLTRVLFNTGSITLIWHTFGLLLPFAEHVPAQARPSMTRTRAAVLRLCFLRMVHQTVLPRNSSLHLLCRKRLAQPFTQPFMCLCWVAGCAAFSRKSWSLHAGAASACQSSTSALPEFG
jgi:hypothetical protein